MIFKSHRMALIAVAVSLGCTVSLPAYSKLDVSNSLLGEDVNANLIRDDIEPYIAKLDLTPYKQALLLELHESMQATLKSAFNKQEAPLHAQREANARACIKESFLYPQENLKYIDAITLNTQARLARYTDVRKRFPIEAKLCDPPPLYEKQLIK